MPRRKKGLTFRKAGQLAALRGGVAKAFGKSVKEEIVDQKRGAALARKKKSGAKLTDQESQDLMKAFNRAVGRRTRRRS